jgi:hypothetical protein
VVTSPISCALGPRTAVDHLPSRSVGTRGTQPGRSDRRPVVFARSSGFAPTPWPGVPFVHSRVGLPSATGIHQTAATTGLADWHSERDRSQNPPKCCRRPSGRPQFDPITIRTCQTSGIRAWLRVMPSGMVHRKVRVGWWCGVRDALIKVLFRV